MSAWQGAHVCGNAASPVRKGSGRTDSVMYSEFWPFGYTHPRMAKETMVFPATTK